MKSSGLFKKDYSIVTPCFIGDLESGSEISFFLSEGSKPVLKTELDIGSIIHQKQIFAAINIEFVAVFMKAKDEIGFQRKMIEGSGSNFRQVKFLRNWFAFPNVAFFQYVHANFIISGLIPRK